MGETEITLAVVGEKLDNLIMAFHDHAKKEERILLGSDGKPGLVVLVDRLYESEKSRKWYFRAIWTAILGLLIKIVWGVK